MKILKNKIFILLIIFFFIEPVTASCKYISYYGNYDYVIKDNFIDNDGTNSILGFANSENIYYTINCLGNYNNPHSIKTDILKNGSYTTSELSMLDPIYFEIKFFETIKIKEIEFDIDVNGNQNTSIKKYVYINASLSNENDNQIINIKNTGTLIQIIDSNEKVRVDLKNLEVNNLYIIFDNSIANSYTVNYFQINEYYKLQQVGWSDKYIENSNVKKVYLCEGTGDYLPDGSDNKWYQNYVTSFSPSVTIANDFIPKFSDYKIIKYDVRNDTHNIGVNNSPSVVQYKLDYANQITDWINYGTNKNTIWYSKSLNSDYIKTSETSGFRYVVTPVYWDNNSNSKISELHNGWCKIYTGNNYSNDCYKHFNYSNNVYQNRFDIGVKTYVNLIDKDQQKISKVDYYLCNIDNECEFIKSTIDETTTLSLYKNGVYYVMADVFDLYNNHNNKKSNLFYIDNLKPNVTFDYVTNKDYVSINWQIEDELSGVKKFRYQISNDNGETYDEFSDWLTQPSYEQTFFSGGQYKIKIEAIDNADNCVEVISEVLTLEKNDFEISNAYGFVYSKNELATLHFRVKCQNCIEEQINIDVLQDNKLIGNILSKVTNEKDFVINYLGNNSETNFVIKIKNNSDLVKMLKITTYEKTNNIYEGNKTNINLSEKVCSMVSGKDGQTDYYEYLSYQIEKAPIDIKAGEGVRVAVKENYYNSCFAVNNYLCETSTESNAIFTSVFSDAAESLKTKYINNNKYVVNMTLDKDYYKLPIMYADKLYGYIYDSKINDDLILAGNKWYTNLNSPKGTYSYLVNGKKIGINEIQIIYNGNYNITNKLLSDIKIRFVDINNPFPNTESAIWGKEYFEKLKNQGIEKVFSFSNSE